MQSQNETAFYFGAGNGNRTRGRKPFSENF